MPLEMKRPSATKGLLGDIVKKITSAVSFALVAGLSGLAMNVFALGGADVKATLGSALGTSGTGNIADALAGTTISGSIPLGPGSNTYTPPAPSISIPETIISTIVLSITSVTTQLERLEAMLQEVGKTSIAINNLTELLELKNNEIDGWLAKAAEWAKIDKERADAMDSLQVQLDAAMERLDSITEALQLPGG